MKVFKIEASRDKICFYTDAEGAVDIAEFAPVCGSASPVELSRKQVMAKDGMFELPRIENSRDRIFSYFDMSDSEGARFVTHFAEDLAENSAPYPKPPIIKTLSAPPGVAKKLGLHQGLINVNLPNLMTMKPGPDDIPFAFNGGTYHFRRCAVEKLDEQMKSVPINTLILLNSPKLFGSTGERELLDICIHPHYDWSCPNAYISAFNVETQAGINCYGAFVAFLAARYTRPDGKYGRAVGAIISNEVNSQYVWGNAGEMDVKDYMMEYARALRIAWLCGRSHCAHFRVYISLDQFWCSSNFGAEPLRYYGSREVLELLNEYVCRNGNFDWGVAYHPYPEDLHCPDFWNDRAVDFTFSTPKITFKNMEVLQAFLSQPRFLCDGRPRRIIFSEQGFNSQKGPLQSLTERQAAAGYVLAYMKARSMPTVDMFTHHACIDNPHEFGLNLGIFRYDPAQPDNLGEPKPIYESFRDMDTPNEPAAQQRARAVIGDELFDYLLNPPLVYGDRDTSEDNAFGG